MWGRVRTVRAGRGLEAGKSAAPGTPHLPLLEGLCLAHLELGSKPAVQVCVGGERGAARELQACEPCSMAVARLQDARQCPPNPPTLTMRMDPAGTCPWLYK